MIFYTSKKLLGGTGAVLWGLALAGCGGKDKVADNVTIAKLDATTTQTPGTPTGPGDDIRPPTRGFEEAARTWGQIDMAKANMDKVVMGKDPSQVKEESTKIRDLVEKLPSQSAALSEDKRKSLESHVADVTQLSGMMGEASDANNEKSIHQHHAAMNDALEMMRGMYPAGALGSHMHMGGMAGNRMGGGMERGPDNRMGGAGMGPGAGMGRGPMAGGNPTPNVSDKAADKPAGSSGTAAMPGGDPGHM